MNKILLMGVILTVMVLGYKYFFNFTENFDIITPLSNEAIQNIASVYNANNLTATNITVTGALTGGTAKITGASQFGNSWFPHTDGKNYIRGPLQIDGATNVASNMTVSGLTVGGLKVSPGAVSPYSAFLDFGDGTGWKLRARNNKGTTLVDLDDNGSMNVAGQLCIGGICLKNNGGKLEVSAPMVVRGDLYIDGNQHMRTPTNGCSGGDRGGVQANRVYVRSHLGGDNNSCARTPSPEWVWDGDYTLKN
jgi:hypothetical protein